MQKNQVLDFNMCQQSENNWVVMSFPGFSVSEVDFGEM